MKIGICTGGGDCPGLNAAIRTAVKTLRGRYGFETYGIKDSFNGLMEGSSTGVFPLEIDDVTDILTKGGTILGTHSSGNPYRDPKKKQDAINKTLEGLKKHSLDGVLVIGGEGTQGIAALLSEHGLPLVGIPKTIDNDLPGTELTIGFSTAADIVRDATEKLHSTAESHHRIMILEVMGRNSGAIALEGGLAGGAHIILIPEIPYSVDSIVKKIRSRSDMGRGFSVVVVAEGAHPVGEDLKYKKTSDNKKVLGGIGNLLAHELKDRVNAEARVTVLGHLQRGGAPNLNDRLLAMRLATRAAEAIADKRFGKYLGIMGDKVVEHDYSDLDRGKRRTVPLDSDYIKVCENIGVSLGRE